jgi:hypothetical protein
MIKTNVRIHVSPPEIDAREQRAAHSIRQINAPDRRGSDIEGADPTSSQPQQHERTFYSRSLTSNGLATSRGVITEVGERSSPGSTGPENPGGGVDAGDADTLVVAKLDRLSRSLIDFATLLQSGSSQPSVVRSSG